MPGPKPGALPLGQPPVAGDNSAILLDLGVFINDGHYIDIRDEVAL